MFRFQGNMFNLVIYFRSVSLGKLISYSLYWEIAMSFFGYIIKHQSFDFFLNCGERLIPRALCFRAHIGIQLINVIRNLFWKDKCGIYHAREIIIATDFSGLLYVLLKSVIPIYMVQIARRIFIFYHVRVCIYQGIWSLVFMVQNVAEEIWFLVLENEVLLS